MKTLLLFAFLLLLPRPGNGMGFPHLSSETELCPLLFAGKVPRPLPLAGEVSFVNYRAFHPRLALNRLTVPKPSLEAVVYTLPENPFLVYVRLDNPQRRMVLIRVYTDKKEKLYADYTRSVQYNVKLNLSELPNGKYRIQIKGGEKVVEKNLQISTLYEQKTQRVLSLAESKTTREQ